MKQEITVVVLLFILFLVWLYRRRETYTENEAQKIWVYFRGYSTGNVGDTLMKSIINIALNDLDKNADLELSNVNAIIDIFNQPQQIPEQWDYQSNVIISPARTVTYTQMDHYPDTASLEQLFTTAYTSGESSLTTRDKMVLRAIAWPALDIAVILPLLSFTYTSDGVPDFTSTIITDSGKSTKDMLVYCFKVLQMLFSTTAGQNPYTPELIDYINSTLPNRFSPKFDRTDNMSIINAINASPESRDEKSTWLAKALTIGPAYLAWLVENKWRLNLDWVRT